MSIGGWDTGCPIQHSALSNIEVDVLRPDRSKQLAKTNDLAATLFARLAEVEQPERLYSL